MSRRVEGEPDRIWPDVATAIGVWFDWCVDGI
jgi:hypothetical protein